LRFDQLQPGSDDDGPIAPTDQLDQGTAELFAGPGDGAGAGVGSGGALVRVETPGPAVHAPRIDRIELPRAASDPEGPGSPDGAGRAPGEASQVAAMERGGAGSTLTTAEHSGSDSTLTTAEHTGSVAVADKASAPTAATAAGSQPAVSATSAVSDPAVSVAPAVFAISELIRTAADQAAATWQVASVPAQRRESPVVAFQSGASAQPSLRPPAAPAFVPEPVSPETDSLGPARDTTHESALDDRHHWPSARRQISLLVRTVCVLVLAVLLGHRYLPDVMGFGSLIDTFLPWTFVPLALAVPAALLSLDKWAIGVTVLACGVWGGDFGPQLARSGGAGPADLRILSQNVSSPPDLTAVANLAGQRQADLVVLQGLTARDAQAADQSVPERFPYHLAIYEFVVWSRYPLVNGSVPMDLATSPADPSQAALGSGASSGQFGGLLRFTVQVDPARVATVYAVHLPQPSLSHDGFGVARGDALKQLVTAVTTEREPNLVVVGDLDLAQTDRGMSSLLNSATGLVSVQAKAGTGFGFTWPSGFPMVRLDDVLTRGLTPVRSVVLPAAGPRQAHRPIEADLRFPASARSAAATAKP
jgi:vancomycin resistance protein VanJ